MSTLKKVKEEIDRAVDNGKIVLVGTVETKNNSIIFYVSPVTKPCGWLALEDFIRQTFSELSEAKGIFTV